MGFELRRGLHWCVCEGHIVFLDVRADRYFALPQRARRAFLRLVRNEAVPGDFERLRALTAHAMLIENGRGDDLRARSEIGPASGDFLDEPHGRANVRDVLAALFSQAFWASSLRVRGLAKTLAALERRRARTIPAAVAERRLARILSGFSTASLVFRSADRCLVRALALRALCCRIGIPAAVVFGVRMNPFRAHCWVQFSGKVLTGDFEQARLFTPLLAVQ